MGIKEDGYTEKVVAFIDVLGFKNHIYESINTDNSTNEVKFNEIQAALNIIIEIADADSLMNMNREVTQFSDSIIISFMVNEKSEVFHTLIELLHMNMELLRYGFLIRGSITTGKCFHNKSRVFGPAVVQAYELEQKANYPRIVVGLDVIKAGIANHANHHTLQDEFEYLKDLIKNDVDGQWYLDYFSTAFSEVDDELMVFDYINNLERIIINNIDRYKNDNRVLPKYLWMKSKYNEMVTPMINQDNIDRFKKKPEIKQGLESLSLIL